MRLVPDLASARIFEGGARPSIDRAPDRALAHRADLWLALARIQPSLLKISGPQGSQSLQPRVMRVLIALADARGGVLSRDDLIEHCWDGIIVGEDAVNRAIGELRRAAREVGGDFGIETIPRVGYRLLEETQFGVADPRPEATLPFSTGNSASRRRVIWGTLALLALGGVGSAVMLRRVDPRAAPLLLRGEQALRDELPDSAEQGIGFLREALAIDPSNARGWGLLALGLRNAAEHAPPEEVTTAVTACEEASAKALSINEKEPNALAALATLAPDYGDWYEAEERLNRVLAVAPSHPWSLAAMGYLMESVGRSRESARLTMRAAALEPLSPVYQYRLAYKHWILGRVVQADQVIDRAMQLWPRHPAVLLARLLIFVWTGRYGPAVAVLDDASGPNSLIPPVVANLWRSSIRALQTRRSADVKAVRDMQVEAATNSPGSAVLAIQVLALLGELDAVFAIADGYLLRQGSLVGSLRTSSRQMTVNDQRNRKTAMLFNPAIASMRSDPRFTRLVEEMGLTDYWRRRGIEPDFIARKQRA